MAVLSQLGFRDWPIPKFASHLVFELHRIEDKFYVCVGYNPNPAAVKNVSDVYYHLFLC